MSMYKIDTLLVSFNLPLYPRQIPQWRGAFVEMAGLANDLLHNHKLEDEEDGDSVHYRYPLAQYRVVDGWASIFTANEGIQALQKSLLTGSWKINWQGHERPLIIQNQPVAQSHFLGLLEKPERYLVHKYIALNQDNFEQYQNLVSARKKLEMLETLLRNHLLSAFWGLGWKGTEKLEVEIVELRHTEMLPYHGQFFLAFDLEFTCNFAIPEGIGVGKAAAFGFGWCVEKPEPRYKRKRINENNEASRSLEVDPRPNQAKFGRSQI
jgi:hypothetical protein